MKWTIAGLILVGLVAAISAAVLAVTLQSNASGPVVSVQDEEVDVMVATRALPANVMVDSTSVGRERMKRSEAPQKSFTNSAQVIGRVLNVPMMAGQAFTEAQFASESNRQLVASIPEGYRAVGVMLSDETGIEDMLYPGAIVDVIASMRLPAANGGVSAEGLSVTLLQGLQVLAVGKRTIVTSEENNVAPDANNARKGRMVTLLVNTSQAEMLQLASTNGKVTVAMRNPLDQEIVQVTGTKMSDLSKDVAARVAQLADSEVTPRMPLMPQEVRTVQTPAVDGAAAGSNGAGSATAAAVTVEPVVKEEPLWITVIHRGRAKEVQKFPMPEQRDDDRDVH